MWPRGFGPYSGVKPVGPQNLAELDGILEVVVFDEEGISAQMIGAIDILKLIGGSKNQDGQGADTFFMADPGEDLEAVHAWQFQVEKDEDREGIFSAIAVFAAPT